MSADFPVFSLETPAFRPLNVMPVTDHGRQLLLITDPMKVIESAVVLAPDPIILLLFQLADGETSVDRIAEIAREKTDMIITADRVRNVVRELDESLLLLSERFIAKMQEQKEEYHNAEVRPNVVFRDPQSEETKKFVADEFSRHDQDENAPGEERLALPRDTVRAVISPHIDYMRGGPTYAWAYKAIREYSKAKTFVILGTLHRGAAHPFIATRKPFETPLGRVEVDEAMLDELAKDFRGELFEEEHLHAQEHTIELQVAYLQKALGPDRPFKIVPILIMPFDEILAAQPPVDPRQIPEIDSFVTALRDLMRRHEDDVCVIGGVDLAHCGPEFGHNELNDTLVMSRVREEDSRALKAIEQVDAKAFFDSFRESMNERNVCSISPIYTLLAAMEGEAEGKLLKYTQANSEDQSCMVTFASVAFVPKSRIILLS